MTNKIQKQLKLWTFDNHVVEFFQLKIVYKITHWMLLITATNGLSMILYPPLEQGAEKTLTPEVKLAVLEYDCLT